MWEQVYYVDIIRWMLLSFYTPLLEKLRENQDRILSRFENTDAYDLVESVFGCVRECLEGCETYLKLPSTVSSILEQKEIKATLREIDEAIESFHNHNLLKPEDPDLNFFDDIKEVLEERLTALKDPKVGVKTPGGPYI